MCWAGMCQSRGLVESAFVISLRKVWVVWEVRIRGFGWNMHLRDTTDEPWRALVEAERPTHQRIETWSDIRTFQPNPWICTSRTTQPLRKEITNALSTKPRLFTLPIQTRSAYHLENSNNLVLTRPEWNMEGHGRMKASEIVNRKQKGKTPWSLDQVNQAKDAFLNAYEWIKPINVWSNF